MGREIRRVPPDWQHPKRDRSNDYQPLYDEDFESACRDWMQDYAYFLTKYPGGFDEQGQPYWEGYGDWPPDRAYHRSRIWTEAEATAYQVYENVTEGTPVSPVFEMRDELRAWLIGEQGMSPEGAEGFIDMGFSFSGVIGPNVNEFGLGAADWFGREHQAQKHERD